MQGIGEKEGWFLLTKFGREVLKGFYAEAAQNTGLSGVHFTENRDKYHELTDRISSFTLRAGLNQLVNEEGFQVLLIYLAGREMEESTLEESVRLQNWDWVEYNVADCFYIYDRLTREPVAGGEAASASVKE